jgi:Helix-turn-helix domain
MLPPPDKGFEPRFVRALDHPVRARFLKLLADQQTITPVEALPLLDLEGLKLSNVAYHARVLELLELVEPAGELSDRESLPFRATPKGEEALLALGFSSEEGTSE